MSLKMQETYQSLECPDAGKSREHKIRHLVKVSCHLHTVSTSLYVIPAVMHKIRSRVCLKRREKAAEVRLNP